MLHVYGDTFIVGVYVYGNNIELILVFKRRLATTFEMIDLGILHYFLSLQVFHLSDGIFISQSKYALDVLKHFLMEDYNPCANPLSRMSI